MTYFNFSNPWTLAIILILIIENLQYYAQTPGGILNLIISIPGLLVAITFHEYAHAFVADKLGDDTPRREGRLTLNPLAHIDPTGMFLMLFAGFGWGKPVNINPYRFNRTISMKKGTALVALAGPCMNFILSIVFAIIYGILLRIVLINNITSNVMEGVLLMVEECLFMNVGLGVFNLIPLPPLDGSKILVALLPKKAENWYRNHEQILYIIFIIIWITPLASTIISPLIGVINNSLAKLIRLIVGA